MEQGNSEKKLAVCAYELLGSAFIMYAITVDEGVFAGNTTFACMLLAWEMSGGHFNPAISLNVYFVERKNGATAGTLFAMILSQLVGACIGTIFGWMALVDKSYMED